MALENTSRLLGHRIIIGGGHDVCGKNLSVITHTSRVVTAVTLVISLCRFFSANCGFIECRCLSVVCLGPLETYRVLRPCAFVWLSSITLVFLSCAPRFSFCFLCACFSGEGGCAFFFIVFVLVFFPTVTRGFVSLGIESNLHV